MKYDYLCVGTGLFSAVFCRAYEKIRKNLSGHRPSEDMAGNIYTRLEENIHVHQYGAIFFAALSLSSFYLYIILSDGITLLENVNIFSIKFKLSIQK